MVFWCIENKGLWLILGKKDAARKQPLVKRRIFYSLFKANFFYKGRRFWPFFHYDKLTNLCTSINCLKAITRRLSTRARVLVYLCNQDPLVSLSNYWKKGLCGYRPLQFPFYFLGRTGYITEKYLTPVSNVKESGRSKNKRNVLKDLFFFREIQ